MSESRESARCRLAVALDVPELARAREIAESLGNAAGLVKVGLELFVAHGPRAVEAATAGGAAIFLDLKVHDIPRTAAAAVRSASRLGARYLTIHALGGPAMIAAARRAADEAGPNGPRLLAVTVLTSHDDDELRRVGLAGTPADEVTRLARMAVDAGAHGLVASALEAASLRDALGDGPDIVTPGIRPAGAARGDQARVATPCDAISAGATAIVVGRPIVAAPDPAAAARSIVDEIASALADA